METEIYSVTHDTPETPEMDQESINIIEELDLEGQKKLLRVDESRVVRNPFPAMTREEELVYRNICPAKHKLREFESESIPLSILKEIALAEKLKLFARIEIWSAPQADDPIVVGLEKDNSYDHGKLWKIGRWGRELFPFEELKEIALKSHIARLKAKTIEEIAKFQGALAALEAGTVKNLGADIGGYVSF